jgi:glutamate-1-semialdehyde aminotransferase
MKRLFQAGGVLCFCIVLAGCSSDSREGLISDTIGMMNQAAKEIDDIQKAVAAATKDVEDGKSNKLTLTAAMKAADKLKETGDKTLEIKARIEMVKSQITDQDRQTNADNKKDELDTAFKNLKTKQDALLKTLADAEKLNVSNAKTAIEELRKKYVIAQSPFEALTR